MHGEVDVKEIMWWSEEAPMVDPETQYSLGLMYARGDGVPQNFELAEIHYTKAAMQGHRASQIELVSFYSGLAGGWEAHNPKDSRGLPRLYFQPIKPDLVEAYIWASILAANGSSNAEGVRNEVAAEIEAEQLADAQRRATELFAEIKANE